MPVRSLNSSIFKWPDGEIVSLSVTEWAIRLAEQRPELLRAGVFGSYARGDWGVSSDIDLILIIHQSETAFWQRASNWDTAGLPVPADVLVYTESEWLQMAEWGERFYRTIQKKAVWVFER